MSSDSNYHVVYETNTDMGGWAFIRTITSYKDEAEFKSFYDEATHGKVIAQGLRTYEEAALLCHMTPSVCYYLSAIEEIFETGEPNLELVGYHLSMAKVGADNVRFSRRVSDLEYVEPKGLEEHMIRLCEDRSTLKGKMFAAVYDSYNAYSDFVNPLGVEILIREAIESQLLGKKL